MIYGYLDVTADGLTVIADWNSPRVLFGSVAVNLPSSSIRGQYLRACRAFGKSWAVMQLNSPGSCLLVCSDGRTCDLFKTAGVNVCIIEVQGDQLHVAVTNSAASYLDALIDPETLQIEIETLPMVATSQGFLDWSPTGPIWTDPNRSKVICGVTFLYAVTRGTITIGQSAVAAQTIITDGVTVGTLIQGDCYEPHLALGDNGSIYYAVRGSNQVYSGVCPTVIPELIAPHVPVVTVPVLPRFSRRLSVMITKDLRAESDADTELIVNQMVQSPRPDGSYRACWAASDSLAGVRGHLIGIYGENDDVPWRMAAAESLIWGYHVKVAWMCDDPHARPIPEGLQAGDLVGTEFFLDPKGGDTVERAVLRWIANLKALAAAWTGDLLVALPFYCMGLAPPHELYSEQETLDAIAAGCALLETEPRVTTLDIFAHDRANGIVAHAGLREMFTRLLKAMPADPTPIEDPMTLSDNIVTSIIAARLMHTTNNQATPARDRVVYMLETVLPPELKARNKTPMDVTDSQRLHWLALTEDGEHSDVAATTVWGAIPS